MKFIQNTDLEDRLRRQVVAEEGEADLMGEGSDETLAFLLLRFWHSGFNRDENLPNTLEDAIARKKQIQMWSVILGLKGFFES